MKNFKFTATALITPFYNQEIDFQSLSKLIKFQLDQGVEGFIVNGTTAESPTLTDEERKSLLEFVKKETGGQVPIVMGTGSNSTAKSIKESIDADKFNADAILTVVPYYNKPPQRGLVEHFTKIANSVSIPTILYNVPGRTITALNLESIKELSRNIKIIGIKEASGNIELAKDIRQECGKNFVLLSGDDGTYVDFLRAGGDGVISVTTHVFPKKMLEWKKRVLQNDKTLDEDFKSYAQLTKLLFAEANPIPVKMALFMMGIIRSPELRLPMVTLSEPLTKQLKDEMIKLGIL